MRVVFRLVLVLAVAVTCLLFSREGAVADPSYGVTGFGIGADVLQPGPGAPVAGPLGFWWAISPTALGLPAGAETDALSYGAGVYPLPGPWHAVFSVDGSSTGHPGSPAVVPTTLRQEVVTGPGDNLGQGDLYLSWDPTSSGVSPGSFSFTAGVQPAPCSVGSNAQLADEDGVAVVGSPPRVGVGLSPLTLDNLDSLDLHDDTFVDTAPAGGDGIPENPVFFSVDPPTAAALGSLPPFNPPSTSPADILAWDPATATLYDWMPLGWLGITPGLTPSDDVDAVVVAWSGAPVSAGFTAADGAAFSLAPGSPSLATMPHWCFSPGPAATPGDVFFFNPFGLSMFTPGIDAEMLGLNTVRSGGTADDNLDALDYCVDTGVDTDVDSIDDGCDFDDDGDLIGDSIDNCPLAANPGQENTDSGPPPPASNTGTFDNGPGILASDGTIPNGDGLADACDTDNDNDGISDDFENIWNDNPQVLICGGFSQVQIHGSPATGDNTNDDNGDGNPAPPMGTDAADNGPSWDTDNDGVLDGVECALGTNPRDKNSKPSVAQCGGTADSDNDGLTVAAEYCKWGTSDTNVDSDGDGVKDCVEANDVNGDGFQNFPGDVLNSAKASAGVIGRTMDFDLNGDGAVNFPGDTLLSAKMAAHAGGICM